MRIELNSAAKKWPLLAAAVAFASAVAFFSASLFLAALWSDQNDLPHLQRAVWLQPGNADYRYRIGLFQQQLDPSLAAQWFRSAVSLNPHQPTYWLHLAAVYGFLQDERGRRDALQHAIAAAPKSPAVAWEAANTYMILGDSQDALAEFRVALANGRISESVQRCWQIKPDPNFLVANVFPKNPRVYEALARLLMLKHDAADTARVWQETIRLNQPIRQQFVFEYMRFALSDGDVDQALRVWQEAAGIASLADYQPSAENLVVNGDFSLPILNGGLDWFYQKTGNVSLALDPSQFYVAPRSLLIDFDRARIEDAGIYHFIPVEQNTEYDFSAYYKTADLEGAGGPEFVLQDALTAAPYFSSDQMTDADFWKEVHGSFKTGPQTKLLALRIQRVPAGDVIKGKLWIDGVRLAKRELEDADQ